MMMCYKMKTLASILLLTVLTDRGVCWYGRTSGTPDEAPRILWIDGRADNTLRIQLEPPSGETITGYCITFKLDHSEVYRSETFPADTMPLIFENIEPHKKLIDWYYLHISAKNDKGCGKEITKYFSWHGIVDRNKKPQVLTVTSDDDATMNASPSIRWQKQEGENEPLMVRFIWRPVSSNGTGLGSWDAANVFSSQRYIIPNLEAGTKYQAAMSGFSERGGTPPTWFTFSTNQN